MTGGVDLPLYADLPIRAGLPAGSSWEVWGTEDRLGCLNLLTAERALAGVRSVVSGDVFPLNLDLASYRMGRLVSNPRCRAA
jgi:hypothetical protein